MKNRAESSLPTSKQPVCLKDHFFKRLPFSLLVDHCLYLGAHTTVSVAPTTTTKPEDVLVKEAGQGVGGTHDTDGGRLTLVVGWVLGHRMFKNRR